MIDDEAPLATMISRALRSDHDVTVSTSAVAAMALIEDGARFDLILCDMVMPVMTGVEFHAALGRMAPRQISRLVFLTGDVSSPAVRAFLDKTGNRCLQKPFDIASLTNVVHATLVAPMPPEGGV